MRPSKGFLGEQGSKAISAEQGNKSLKLRGTGKQGQFSGAENIENQNFDFEEQGKMPFFSGEQRNRYPLVGPH